MHVLHTFQEMKEVLWCSRLTPTDHLNTSRDWCEPPLNWLLESLGMVCAVLKLISSTIITVKGEPLTCDLILIRNIMLSYLTGMNTITLGIRGYLYHTHSFGR
jgi:hypothetical protein